MYKPNYYEKSNHHSGNHIIQFWIQCQCAKKSSYPRSATAARCTFATASSGSKVRGGKTRNAAATPLPPETLREETQESGKKASLRYLAIS